MGAIHEGRAGERGALLAQRIPVVVGDAGVDPLAPHGARAGEQRAGGGESHPSSVGRPSPGTFPRVTRHSPSGRRTSRRPEIVSGRETSQNRRNRSMKTTTRVLVGGIPAGPLAASLTAVAATSQTKSAPRATFG